MFRNKRRITLLIDYFYNIRKNIWLNEKKHIFIDYYDGNFQGCCKENMRYGSFLVLSYWHCSYLQILLWRHMQHLFQSLGRLVSVSTLFKRYQITSYCGTEYYLKCQVFIDNTTTKRQPFIWKLVLKGTHELKPSEIYMKFLFS